jgi:hypothetical protein
VTVSVKNGAAAVSASPDGAAAATPVDAKGSVVVVLRRLTTRFSELAGYCTGQRCRPSFSSIACASSQETLLTHVALLWRSFRDSPCSG